MKDIFKKLQVKIGWGSAAVISKNVEQQLEKALPNNPYFQSKMLWHELYGNVQVKLENSYRIIAILSFTLLIAIIGFIIVAGETKVQPVPFVLRGDSLLTVSDLSDSQEFQRLKPKLALYFTRQFIESVRTVTTDGDVNRQHHMQSIAFANSEALGVLKTYFDKHDADVIAQKSVVSVENLTVLPESANTVVARWVDVARDPVNGDVLYRKPFIAQLTYGYEKPSNNETLVRLNPLGFVIHYLSWSQDHTV